MAEKVQLEIEVKGGDSVGKASEKVQSLRSQLKEMKAELASGNLSTEAFNKLSIKAGELQDRIGDVNQRVKNLASDSGKLDGFVSVATGIAGGFAAAQGAIALFGDENQDLQKTLVKVQGAVAVLNGFQAVANTLNKDSAALTLLQTTRLKILTFVQTRYAAAVGTTTGAMKLLRIAGAALGIGLIIAGIAALVANFDKLKNVVMKFIPSMETLGNVFTKVKNSVTDFLGITSDTTRAVDKFAVANEKKNKQLQNEIEILEALGGKEEQIYRKKALMISNNILLLERQKLAGIVSAEEYSKKIDELRQEEAVLNAQHQKKLNDDKKKEGAKSDKEEDQAKKEKERKLKEFQKNAEQQQKDSFEKGKQIDKDRRDYENEQQEIQDQYDEAVILREKEQLEQRVSDEIAAGEQLNQAKWAAGMAGVSIAQQLAGKNKAAADALFAIEKGLAIAQVIVNTQKEIAGYYANPTWSLLPDGGAAIKTSYAVGAKVRAATSIATIAASAIGRYSSSGGSQGGSGGGSTPQNQNPNVQGFSTTNTRTNQTGDTGSQRVYVTETDITRVINKVSKIKNQATVE